MDRHRLGNLIRTRREALRLSLRDAGRLGTIAHSSWGHVELGSMNATVDTLAEIARVLEAHWDVRLVGGHAAPDPLRAELVDRLSGILDRLPDQEVRRLLNQVAFLEAEVRGDQGHNKQ